jgi:hypothetical protein
MADIRNWRKWREKQKERSDKARRAVNTRWGRYHAEKALDPEPSPIPDPYYRLTIENFVTGESHVLEFHPGDRLNRFKITIDGKVWTVCGWSRALARIRKSCIRMATR